MGILSQRTFLLSLKFIINISCTQHINKYAVDRLMIKFDKFGKNKTVEHICNYDDM